VADPVTTGVILAGTLAVAKRVETFIAAASGHPGEDIGTILGNIASRRRQNAETVIGKSDLILLNLGENPGEVPLNILHPVLEAASLQEDPCLQDTWANLLANAADPRQTNPVLPVFATMLKDLTAREVKFLDALLEVMAVKQPNPHHHIRLDARTKGFSAEQLMDVASHAKLLRYRGSHTSVTVAQWKTHEADLVADRRNFEEMMGLLKRNQILDEIVRTKPIDVMTPIARAVGSVSTSKDIEVETVTFYRLSQLGTAFVNACRPPFKTE